MTREEALARYEYRDGVLYHRLAKGRQGKPAGCLTKDGYIQLRADGRAIYAHRVVFLLHHGFIPPSLDHIDTDKTNNRIENLRQATSQQNARNRSLSSSSTSGKKGVIWRDSQQHWRVMVSVGGRTKEFGTFKDREFAELVADTVRERFHGNFANHG